MNDLAQFFRALCRRWCQYSGEYDIEHLNSPMTGEWYRVGPWFIVIAKETPDA